MPDPLDQYTIGLPDITQRPTLNTLVGGPDVYDPALGRMAVTNPELLAQILANRGHPVPPDIKPEEVPHHREATAKLGTALAGTPPYPPEQPAGTMDIPPPPPGPLIRPGSIADSVAGAAGRLWNWATSPESLNNPFGGGSPAAAESVEEPGGGISSKSPRSPYESGGPLSDSPSERFGRFPSGALNVPTPSGDSPTGGGAVPEPSTDDKPGGLNKREPRPGDGGGGPPSGVDSLSKALAGLKAMQPNLPAFHPPAPYHPSNQISRSNLPQVLMGEILGAAKPSAALRLGQALKGHSFG